MRSKIYRYAEQYNIHCTLQPCYAVGVIPLAEQHNMIVKILVCCFKSATVR